MMDAYQLRCRILFLNKGILSSLLKKLVNSVSLLEKFNDFIEMGQAMGFTMKGCETDLHDFLIRMAGEEIVR